MASQMLPATMRRLVVTGLSQKFREVVKIETIPLPSVGPNQILVKNRFVGINASDVNYSAGKYDSTVKPPFGCGFEAVGQTVVVGKDVKLFKPGQPIGYMVFGAFADYTLIGEKQGFPLPSVAADYLPLLVSGLTASIALDKVGEIKKGEKVLVTAAAGGTGTFAVQWAKLAGCHVIGTCSGDEKARLLLSLGCDRVIDYEKEDVAAVLAKEYPTGLDVVYESVGGNMFDACVNNLAKFGRLIVIGYITGYQSERGFAPSRTAATLPQRLLSKSASVRGFLLFNHHKHVPTYFQKLVTLLDEKKLHSIIDQGQGQQSGPFNGLESIFDAVDYMYSRRSKGKIIVGLPETAPPSRL